MMFLVKFEGYLDGSLSYDVASYEADSAEDALAMAKVDTGLGWIGGSYEPPTYEVREIPEWLISHVIRSFS